MAQTKVSELTALTSPDGAEELLINDSGTSKKITIDNVTENNFTDVLKSKLDAVEASADVTDATNVTAAGALMDSELAGIAAVKATTGTFLTADQTKLDGIATSATVDQSASAIKTLLEDGIDSIHYVDGSIDEVHIADDAVTADKLANSINTAIAANTAKTTNATHTGDVTGATALTIAVDAVDLAMLSATGTASSSTFLRGDNTWDVPIGGVTSVNSVTGAVTAANIATAVEAASDSNTFTDADHTKLNAVAASANNYVHPNHSGEVTSTADGATVLVDNIVDEANLKSDNSPTNDYVLTAKSSAAGGLTWAEIESGNTTANPMWEMAHTVSSNYVMTTNYNGVSVAPVTINSSISVTVPSGSTWTIV